MGFNDFANKLKDVALQELGKWFANRYHLKRFGKIAELRLNSAAEEIFVVLELHGEEKAIELTARYHVVEPTVLEIVEVKASRQWMEVVINEVIPTEQKRMTVPTAVTRALSKMK